MNYIRENIKDCHFRIINTTLESAYGILNNKFELIDIELGLQIPTYNKNILGMIPVNIEYSKLKITPGKFNVEDFRFDDLENGQWFEIIYKNSLWSSEQTTGDLLKFDWCNCMTFYGDVYYSFEQLKALKKIETIVRINTFDVEYNIIRKEVEKI
jgi:hypothetical protein